VPDDLAMPVSPALRAFIDQALAHGAAQADPSDAVLALAPLMMRLLQHAGSFLQPEHFRSNPAGYTRNLIHAAPDHSLSLYALVWLPGQWTPVHDHGSWGVVGVVEGVLEERSFVRLSAPAPETGADHGIVLARGGIVLLPPGAVTTFVPNLQEVEVHALVGLQHTLQVQLAVAPWPSGATTGLSRMRCASSASAVAASGGFDTLSRMRSPVRTRPAARRRRLGCHVQHDGAGRGAAHAAVRDAHHVLHALARQLARDGEAAGLGHAGARPCGPMFFSTSTSSAVTSRSSSSMRVARSSTFSNTTARPSCSISAGEAADCLMMAPPGARLPRRKAMPPCGVDRPAIGCGPPSAGTGRGRIELLAQRAAGHRQRIESAAGLQFAQQVAMPPAAWKSSM
jgi:predicted metal-dependent enzyme (double-stranded beta helix superfamily)